MIHICEPKVNKWQRVFYKYNLADEITLQHNTGVSLLNLNSIADLIFIHYTL